MGIFGQTRRCTTVGYGASPARKYYVVCKNIGGEAKVYRICLPAPHGRSGEILDTVFVASGALIYIFGFLLLLRGLDVSPRMKKIL